MKKWGRERVKWGDILKLIKVKNIGKSREPLKSPERNFNLVSRFISISEDIPNWQAIGQ